MIKNVGIRLLGWVDRHWLEFFGFAAVGLLMLIVLWPLIVYNIAAGHVGVMWYRFLGGTVTATGSALQEGIHFILPWDKVFVYDARLQRIDESVEGLSVDGLTVKLNLSSRFVIASEFVGFLHKAIGPNYAQTLMRPQLRTLVLTYISEKEAADLYSTRRGQVQNVIATQFQEALAHISSNVPFALSYVSLQDVLIEEIDLPPFVRKAIEEKERVRHMAEAYEFRLLLEIKERRRKTIEAEGIRSFQEIVAPGITDSYLRWRGIEATLQLSKSNNAKVVIIGNGAGGLPIILNTESLASAPEKHPEVDTKLKANDRNSEPAQGPAYTHPQAGNATGDVPIEASPPKGATGDNRAPPQAPSPQEPQSPETQGSVGPQTTSWFAEFSGPTTSPAPNPLGNGFKDLFNTSKP
jgi:regulator of protease activity HflC (stomatin/prohibitin superfamily)